MVSRLLASLGAAVAGLLLAASAASAHPHVWVKMKSEVLYGPDGAMTGVRHAWTFDDMFSVFATQGLEQKEKGKFTREELAPLAEVNVTSLKEYDFFTYAKADGKKAAFVDPVDYWLDYTDEVLTLHFTLPLKTPLKAKTMDIEMYDPTYFVDFSFADHDPAKLVGAPGNCRLDVERPKDLQVKPGQTLSEAFFNQLSQSQNWGQQFANKIFVKC